MMPAQDILHEFEADIVGDYLRREAAHDDGTPFCDRRAANATHMQTAWRRWVQSDHFGRMCRETTTAVPSFPTAIARIVTVYATPPSELVRLLLDCKQSLVACALADYHTVRASNMTEWMAEIATWPPELAFCAALYRFHATWRGWPICYEAIVLWCAAARRGHADAVRMLQMIDHATQRPLRYDDRARLLRPSGDEQGLVATITAETIRTILDNLDDAKFRLGAVARAHVCAALLGMGIHRSD